MKHQQVQQLKRNAYCMGRRTCCRVVYTHGTNGHPSGSKSRSLRESWRTVPTGFQWITRCYNHMISHLHPAIFMDVHGSWTAHELEVMGMFREKSLKYPAVIREAPMPQVIFHQTLHSITECFSMLYFFNPCRNLCGKLR